MPSLPDSDILEYQAPGGDLWRVEDPMLLEEFAIEASDLPAWHGQMSTATNFWGVVQRYFGVWPVVSAGPDARQWMPQEIGKHYGQTHDWADSQLDLARAHWRLARNAIGGAIDTAIVGAGAPAEAPRGIDRSYQEGLSLSQDEIDAILVSNGFNDLLDLDERRRAAMRLRDLDDLLTDAESRPMVHQAIRMEMDLQYLNRTIAQKRSAEAGAKSEKAILDATKRRDEMQAAYNRTMEALGATQAQRQSSQRRQDFQASLGAITAGMQAYYGDGTRELLDGMFTAAEISFLMHPVVEREPQYDPQVVLQTFQANQNLWSKDWDGFRLPRAVSRRLRKAWKSVIDEIYADEGVEPRRLEDGTTLGGDGDDLAPLADEDDSSGDTLPPDLAGDLPGAVGLESEPAPLPSHQLAHLAQRPGAGGDDLVACG